MFGLFGQLSNTIVPWIIGAAGILLFGSITLTFRSWRELKRSPYYFMRRQAEQDMQTYSLASIVLGVVLLFVVSYAWQPPKDTTPRYTALESAKPIPIIEEIEEFLAEDEGILVEVQTPETVEVDGATSTELAANLLALQNGLTISTLSEDNLTGGFDLVGPLQPAVVGLPPEYDRLEAAVKLNPDTVISSIDFSAEINDFDLVAVKPTRLFEEGSFTIYATFEYNQMADGMVWSWVWRRDGQVVSGGNEEWVYGNDGPGYVYFNPREGFTAGEYSLEIWVNGEVMSQANLFITNDIAASQ